MRGLHGAVALLAAVAAGCSAPGRIASTDAFRNVKAVESALIRGVSTRDDVTRLLGAPTGGGGAFLPSLTPVPREILFYDDIEMTDYQASQGAIHMDVRQQILLVFLREDRLDGFLWFTNVADVDAWVRESQFPVSR